MSRSRACADDPRDAVAAPPTRTSRIALIARLAPCFLAAVVHRPPRPCPQDAAFKSPLTSPQVICRRRAPSLVCATSARSSNTCQTVTLCMTSSMRRSRTVIVGRIFTGIGFIWLASYIFFVCFLCFNFVLDSCYSPLVVPYRLRHRTPSTTACFDFAPAVAPLTSHLFAIII